MFTVRKYVQSLRMWISNPDILSWKFCSTSLSQFLCLYMTAFLCSVAVVRIKCVNAFSELCTVPGINECSFYGNHFFKASFSSGIDYSKLDQEDSGNVGV